MRFPTVVAAAAVLAASTGVSAQFSIQDIIGFDLTPQNNYGAPSPPWHGGKPGWYYGNNPQKYPQYPCLTGVICRILQYFPYVLQCPHPPPPPPPPHHTTTKHTTSHTTSHSTSPTTTPTPTTTTTPTPTPSNGYTQTFSNITAAVQADDYQTFGLVDTIAQCEAMCDNVQGCVFVNAYDDVNGKDGSTQLTCALFSGCHSALAADNRGGQTQPDGTVDSIANSAGFCKVGNTVPPGA